MLERDTVPTRLPPRRFPLAFNEHVPAPQCEGARQDCSRGILQGWGRNWRRMKAAKGFRQNTFPSLALSKSAPHPDACEAAHPKGPDNGSLKSVATCMETINILSYALGSEKMHNLNRQFLFSFTLFVLFQWPFFSEVLFSCFNSGHVKGSFMLARVCKGQNKCHIGIFKKGSCNCSLPFFYFCFSVVFTWTL